jgi:arylsulfatase A-like enzyme
VSRRHAGDATGPACPAFARPGGGLRRGLSTSEGSPTSNLPFRAGKGWLYEGGIRVPLLPAQHRDGVSFLAAIENPAAENRERPLLWHYPHWGNQGGRPGGAVRLGDWKLIDWYWGREPELFNLADDLGERTNLAATHPKPAQTIIGSIAIMAGLLLIWRI